MDTAAITFRPIGIIRSEHTSADATPIQPVYARDCLGRAEILPEFADGLADIEGFSHLYLIYHLDRAEPAQLRVKPYLQDVEHGIFATRAVNSALKLASGQPAPLGLIDGHWMQVPHQLLGAAVGIAMAVVGTLVALKVTELMVPLRVAERDESSGMDLALHGEEGYNFEE